MKEPGLFRPKPEITAFSAAIALMILCALAAGGPNAMQWDNFEFLTPLIRYTHEKWLQGSLPLFAFNQHMGDPLLGNGQAGVFYFPYTLALIFAKLAGWEALGFSATVVWLHAWLSGLGWYLLLRAVRVEIWIAAITALGISCGGFYQFNSSIWLDMTPAFTWLGWTLLGLHLFLQKRRVFSAALMIVGSTALMGFSGHPQMMVYYGTSVILFLLAHQALFPADWRRNFMVLGAIALGILFATPSIFPILEQFKYSLRTGSFSEAVFFERGTNLDYLISLLNPTTRAKAEFFDPAPLSLLLYQGSWVCLGLFAGLLGIGRRFRSAPEYQRMYLVLALTSGIMFWLALGRSGGLYSLTYHLPVWSSFRWPFKIYYLALPALAAAAGCGLQVFKNLSFRSQGVLAAALTSLSLVVYGIDGEWNFSPWLSLLAAASAVLVLLCFLFSHRPWMRAVTAGLAVINVACVVALIQNIRFHDYAEAYGSVGAAQLGVSDQSRVLALSRRPADPKVPLVMQEYAHLQAAMMNDYESATGCVTALVPAWRMVWLPADVFGIPYPMTAANLLSSHLASSYNIGYFVVAKYDTETQARIGLNPDLRLSRSLPLSLVYRNTKVLPQVYWATEAHNLVQGQFPRDFTPAKFTERAVFVEGLEESIGWVGQPPDPAFSKGGASVEVGLNNTQPGFLVLSYTWYPTWRVWIDGAEAQVFRVNGTIMGVEVPANSRKLVLRFEDAGLKKSRFTFLLAVLLSLAAFLVWMKGRMKSHANS